MLLSIIFVIDTLLVIRKSTRARSDVNYSYSDLPSVPNDQLKFTKVLESRVFVESKFQKIKGRDLTADWCCTNGLRYPVIIPTPEGLGMTMPSASITVREIANVCGLTRIVEVIEVATQSTRTMTLDKWAAYFEQPPRQRRQILNVISLEFSDTPLAKLVKRPRIVGDLDWLDRFWPASRRAAGEYPKVQLYCLMGVKDSYTDFHIDFGGTSVFYHLLSGEKVFYFIEPTPENLEKYSAWSTSSDQSDVFLGDQVDECVRVHLRAGNTMMIPAGWIHAVYTPKDAIVIGGNFLHGLDIARQLSISRIEIETNVPHKFRYGHNLAAIWICGIASSQGGSRLHLEIR
ncbi:lysine-specific demethylase 2B-like protein [Polychytrium aggregatum]|uniref:lysine-specific demethylase 2B-like protein n=1 Tax=Polychytrium aggregatum TaxID=110093 RepID=UPI0022FDC663|nr:lysine-specific demethylase 2B-like protein [Polychytrium aggregatum]KAI9209865.1 lysine-specific demethylase 2B-like protein [Polychytrium aggregatum]